MTTLAAALTVIAIVTQDQAVLRAAPKDSATQQAVLWQGDSLEIRGQKGDYLQVYDHRRERAGYIRATQIREQSITPESAPELLSIVRFLKDTPGLESLGISYSASFLVAAPANSINAEVFDAIGTMAERLARRGSSKQNKYTTEIVTAHLDLVSAYGIKINSIERDEQVTLCYDGEAYRRVMAMNASPLQKANAALGLTRHECVPVSLSPADRLTYDTWRAEILDRVEIQHLPDVIKNRLHIRKAGLWANLAYQRARRTDLSHTAAQAAAKTAIEELAAVNKSALMESDLYAYNDAAVRVGASRWAAEPTLTPPHKTDLQMITRAGEPGQTCVELTDASNKKILASRCTYSIVWPASFTVNREGNSAALAVQPLESWRELWIFQKTAEGWKINALPPGAEQPTVGYIEFAGWVPGGVDMLAAREIKKDGRYRQSYELLKTNTQEVTKQADRPGSLSTFYRWQDPLWKAGTISLR